MKVIDILVKLANKENVPKKISINDYNVYDEYTIWTFKTGCYGRNINGEEYQFLFEYITTDMLNDEVEIIEDIPKEIEKIDISNFPKRNNSLKKTALKINEIIDRINGGNNNE